jgi:hypothetical protein
MHTERSNSANYKSGLKTDFKGGNCMTRPSFHSITAVLLFVSASSLFAQQSANWLTKEFSDSILSLESVESFINNDCRPSGLDGIQLLGVQNGHNDAFHLHVYCRHDNAKPQQYKVMMEPIPNRNPDAAVNKVIGNPNVRVGPFYFGLGGRPDAFVLIERMK